MKNGLLKTSAIGNVGMVDQLRDAGSSKVLNFSLAVNYEYKKRGTDEKVIGTDWIRCSIFGNRAESLANYIKEGQPLYLEGRPSAAEPWEDKNKKDVWKTTLQLKVTEVLFLDSNRREKIEDAEEYQEAEAYVGEDLFPKKE